MQVLFHRDVDFYVGNLRKARKALVGTVSKRNKLGKRIMAKKEENLHQAVYKEMERKKLNAAAVAAFRHKPYKLDWKKEEQENGEKR